MSISKHLTHNEPTLTITHTQSKHQLRAWHGPMARLIHIRACRELHNKAITIHLDKYAIQHVLILACLIHQQCLLEYQVIQDLEPTGLLNTTSQELLLFMRMSQFHLNHSDITQFCEVTQCDHQIVNKLLQAFESEHLIQRIQIGPATFFDKNPIPHRHWYNHQTEQLIDAPPTLPLPVNCAEWQEISTRLSVR